MGTLSTRDLERLKGVHPDLVAIVKKARETSDFIVIEGLRTKERQAILFGKGASQTMNSRHLTGHAVDIAPIVGGQLRWDWPLFYPMADSMKKAASSLNIPIDWGGDWSKFRDGPHFELSRKTYP